MGWQVKLFLLNLEDRRTEVGFGVTSGAICFSRPDRRKDDMSYTFLVQFLTWVFVGFAGETMDRSSDMVSCNPNDFNRAFKNLKTRIC